ncbi:bleomycin hydrolase, partial [Coemansia sp. RSA 2618]
MTVLRVQPTSNTSSYARHILTKMDELTPTQLSSYNDEFDADVKNKLAALTLSREAYSTALGDRAAYLQQPAVFSHKVAIDPPITNQKSSGRCWIFACLNLLRLKMMQEYKLEELELSQPFLFFYDKLEKANWFLENVLMTADEDVEGRLMQYLLKEPINDGGQFDMIVALLEKYGVVPKDAYPETFHTGNSREMNALITSKLREYAKELREAHGAGVGAEELRARKRRMLGEVHRVLVISLGAPPERVTWAFYDKDKKFHEFRGLTPQEFYREHVRVDCTRLV